MQTLVVIEMTWPQSKFCISLFYWVVLCWIYFPTFSRLLQNLISKSIQCYITVVEDGFSSSEKFKSWLRAQAIIVKLEANERMVNSGYSAFIASPKKTITELMMVKSIEQMKYTVDIISSITHEKFKYFPQSTLLWIIQ